MRLTLEQICAVAQGAERIVQEDDGIRFYRFREEERLVYPAIEHYDNITAATAGIQLEFSTDATDLYMQVTTKKATNRSFFCHDIFVNDRLVGCLRNYPDGIGDTNYSHDEFSLGQFSGSYSLGAGNKTVRIVFPWSVVSCLEDLTLKNATFITPVKHSKTVLMYGDSITQGYDSLNPSQSYSLQLARHLDAEAYIKAIGGEVFRPGLSQVAPIHNPDYITVAYGTNDWNIAKDEETFVENCNGFLEALSQNYPQAKIFVISPIYRTDTLNPDKSICPFQRIEETIQKAAAPLNNVTFLSGKDMIPPDALVLADRWIHPNNQGFAHYFENLKNALTPYL